MKLLSTLLLVGMTLGACSGRQDSSDDQGNCTPEAVQDYNQIVGHYSDFSEKRDTYNKDLAAKRQPRVKLTDVCGSARNLESSSNKFLEKYGEDSSCMGVTKDENVQVSVDGATIAAVREDIQFTIQTHCE